MNIYTGKDLARSFREVRGNTITIAEEIPESQYAFQAAPETRSVAQSARCISHLRQASSSTRTATASTT